MMTGEVWIAGFLAFLIIAAAPTNAGQKRPLTESDLLRLLAGGVYCARVAMLVRERGIGFSPTKRDLELLQHAGADEEVRRAVVTARRMTSATAISKGPGGQQLLPRALSNRPVAASPVAVVPPTPISSPNLAPLNSVPLASVISSAPQNVIASGDEMQTKDFSADGVARTMEDWLGETKHQTSIPAGTKITKPNWQQYKQFMPVGMVGFFEGRYFWKMPDDVKMEVGPTIIHPLSRSYTDATKRYDNQARILHLPDGRLNIANYIAGMPFPSPQEPDKGEKILANLWFPDQPYLQVMAPEGAGPARICTMDRFGNNACTRMTAVYRQLAFNHNPAVPRTEPSAGGAWYTEWLMVEQPFNSLQIGTWEERSRYTIELTIFWQDITRAEDNYVYIPALRHPLRFSGSGGCAALFGTDILHDDQRAGYSGGISAFTAQYYGERKILALTDLTNADGLWPAEYDQPLGWATPSWGSWSLRNVYVIDVRRVPSQRGDYCYGSNIMYVDAQFMHQLWEEIYDTKLRLWKIVGIHLHPAEIDPGEGLVPLAGALVESYWDVQREHLTHLFTADSNGKTDGVLDNERAPKRYDDVAKYSTPGGLMEILQ